MSDLTPSPLPQNPLPVWLTQDFLQQIVRNHRPSDGINVLGFTAKPAVGKGENYSSDLLRVRVQYSSGKNSEVEHMGLIVKTKLSAQFEAASVIEEMNSFGIEINAYQLVLPKVHELLRSIGDESVLAPKCLAADEEIGYLVFEDLSERGYYMIDRRDGLNMEQFRYTLEPLAKWHAATVCILDKDPLIGTKFMPAQFDKSSDPWRLVIENTLTTLVDYCARHPHLAHIGPKFTSQVTTIYNRLCEKCTESTDGFIALCHGDLWSNNILFRNVCSGDEVVASERINDAMLIDFQQVFNGSVCLDLMLLLHGASHEDLHQGDWDELVQHYHTTYANTLRKLKFPEPRIPTLTMMHGEMLRLCICSAYISMMMIGGRNLGGVEEDPIGHYIYDKPEDRVFRLEALLHPRCTKILQYLLNYYDRKGVFD